LPMTSQTQSTDYSIQTRLLISVSILLFVFLGLTGVVLDRAFRNSIEAGAADRLQVQVYVLLGSAEEEGGEFYFLEGLREPRFTQLNSGLYGFISSNTFGELWRSESARTLSLADSDVLQQTTGVGQSLFSKTLNSEQEELFVVSYGILWEDGVSEYSFTVMETSTPYYSEISNFRTSLWTWLGGVAVLLLMIQLFLMRWGLSPLHQMAADLKRIESGDHGQLQGAYPKELRGVTDNLNLLIKSERKQQARYRTTLGDLAHSLKTPLAVIAGVMQQLTATADSVDANTSKQLVSVDEQLARMNQIVTYQLQRAVQTSDSSALARRVNVATVIGKILEALRKVYGEKAMQCTQDMDEKAVFLGDERDLLEIMGNVLDNAFKYGKSRISVSVQQWGLQPGELKIKVTDDGPGIPLDKQEFVLQRGARADTLVQGQGIGLAVMTDIVTSYGGEISINNLVDEGACIEMVFKIPQRV
jgi:two-component system sensor histidine kinase PhoQ